MAPALKPILTAVVKLEPILKWLKKCKKSNLDFFRTDICRNRDAAESEACSTMGLGKTNALTFFEVFIFHLALFLDRLQSLVLGAIRLSLVGVFVTKCQAEGGWPFTLMMYALGLG